MHAVGTLIGIALNLCVALGGEDTLLILPVHRCFLFFLRFYFYYLFLERGREQGGEKHQCVVASRTPPTGDLAHNPGLCPDWESNWRPFGLQAGTQSIEPPQPGH